MRFLRGHALAVLCWALLAALCALADLRRSQQRTIHDLNAQLTESRQANESLTERKRPNPFRIGRSIPGWINQEQKTVLLADAILKVDTAGRMLTMDSLSGGWLGRTSTLQPCRWMIWASLQRPMMFQRQADGRTLSKTVTGSAGSGGGAGPGRLDGYLHASAQRALRPQQLPPSCPAGDFLALCREEMPPILTGTPFPGSLRVKRRRPETATARLPQRQNWCLPVGRLRSGTCWKRMENGGCHAVCLCSWRPYAVDVFL